jgi:hypothetical protein
VRWLGLPEASWIISITRPVSQWISRSGARRVIKAERDVPPCFDRCALGDGEQSRTQARRQDPDSRRSVARPTRAARFWKTVLNRFSNWSHCGPWATIFNALHMKIGEEGVMNDAFVVRAHWDASGEKGGSWSELELFVSRPRAHQFVLPDAGRSGRNQARATRRPRSLRPPIGGRTATGQVHVAWRRLSRRTGGQNPPSSSTSCS